MRTRWLVMGMASFFFGCDGASDGVEVAPLGMNAGRGKVPGMAECRTGEMDRTFGGAGTGIARLSITPDDAGGFFAMERDQDGIVAAGHGIGGLGGSTFKVARLRPGGRPDPSFADGHVVKTYWGASTANYAFARGVGRQSDGKIVAIGWFEKGPQQDVALARYDVGGALDTTFGGDGQPLVDLGGAEVIEAGLVADDDSIVAAGRHDDHLLVVRFGPDGALDPSFGGGTGHFTAEIGDWSTASSVLIDTSGRIVVGGTTKESGQSDVLVLRLTPAGELDASFGNSGIEVTRDLSGNERAVGIARTVDGGILLGGDVEPAEAGSDPRDFLVRRYHADGRPDVTFGTAGFAAATITDGSDEAEGITLAAGGDILVVGNASGGSANGPVVARYTPVGELHPAFGTGGVLPLDLGEYGVAHTIVASPGRKALIGGGDEGASPGPGTYAVIARLCL